VRKYPNGKVLTTPSKKNVKAFLEKVRGIIETNRALDAGKLVLTLNPVIDGWARYHAFGASTQTFNSVIEKLNYKRQLTPSTFAEVRVMRTMENLIFRYPYDIGSFSDFYEDLQTSGTGEAFNYTSQLSSKHEVSFGTDAWYYKNQFTAGTLSLTSLYQPLEDFGCPQVQQALNFPGTPLLTTSSAFVSTPGTGGCYIGPYNAAINAAVPGSTLVTIEGAGHISNVEQPAKFTGAIRDFLKG